ncbi:hypothetical protein B0I35DRAFT_418212 [Stachybotrys elegans]|uniref:Uncharacterized protein n=1 Tax=Stachybotrys elegans TaxID=80388 RepID=A0A8K0SZ25_9HYPO|nr:hypothetical protein B0I35DRAFT_418212 [Stachybotrys elegans]
MSTISPGDLSRTASGRARGRHQIKRSITELTSPVRLHLQNHPLRKDRYNDDKQPQSANPAFQFRSSLEIPQSEGTTPLMSPNQSRRASIMLHREEEETIQPREPKGERAPQKEQQQVRLQVEGLKQSLEDLHTFSTSTSRQLDRTYFAVLEKMTTLQSTVMALKDLAESSQDIHGTFEKESRGLEHDIVTQLSAVGRFEQQQTKIEGLQDRIHSGRTQMQSLSRRVDVVRERIEGWAKADAQWRERTRKRLKVIWIIASVIVLAMLLLLWGADQDEAAAGRAAVGIPRQIGPDNSTLEIDLHQEEEGDASGGRLKWETPTGGEERLRVFDEL